MGPISAFSYPPGATPLDPDEAEGLIPYHITTQAQLNEWEQYNIIRAQQWLSSGEKSTHELLTEDFVKKLHLRMFNKTWRWAGHFRKTNKNIGIYWQTIPIALKNLLDDAKYQLENAVYSSDEIIVRFHHRLVSIHPFANGNGRHARLLADALLLAQDQVRFSWGSVHKLTQQTPVRETYINALRQADQGNYQPLIVFVRS